MYGKLALCFIGLSSGGVIAAGIFAFLAIIGVFPRLIGVTHTRCHMILYETLLILGGTAGNLMDLFHLPLAGAPPSGERAPSPALDFPMLGPPVVPAASRAYELPR